MERSMYRAIVVAVLLTLLDLKTATARIEPSFHLEQVSWDATHIVVVEPDRKLEGQDRVVESWKGDLMPGAVAPPLRVSLANSVRRIYDNAIGDAREREPRVVGDNRRVLFLIRKASDDGQITWQSAAGGASGDNQYNHLPVSVIWIEDGRAYAIQQWKNPGPARMLPVRVYLDHEPFHEDLDEARVKTEVARCVELQLALRAAVAIDDRAERAAAIRPLLQRSSPQAWRAGFPALGKCGRAGVAALGELLMDPSLLKRHAEILQELARIGSPAATTLMVEVVRAELLYWREVAPELPPGWRTGKDTPPHIAASAQQHNLRLSKALEYLAAHPVAAAREPVIELKEYWASLPQLDGMGPRHIGKRCDQVLGAIR